MSVAAAAATSSAESRTVKLLKSWLPTHPTLSNSSFALVSPTLSPEGEREDMMEGRGTRGEPTASAQVFEDRIWALLPEQSRGHLHVFRPLLDRGVDALLHRLSDGAYIPLPATGG